MTSIEENKKGKETIIMTFTEEIAIEGHLVDSNVMSKILDEIVASGMTFDIVEFKIGRTNKEISRAKIIISGEESKRKEMMGRLHRFGAKVTVPTNVELAPCPKDSTAPENFYSTTNHKTQVRIDDKWYVVDEQRMDAVIVIDRENKKAVCKKIRSLKKGDMVATGISGIAIEPTFKSRERSLFEFMSGDVSSERVVRTIVSRITKQIHEIRSRKGKIVVVAGPVVIHTGGSEFLAALIRDGYVDTVLSGNALAVHDIEHSLYGTSLGTHIKSGDLVHEGHKNHIMAINKIMEAGSIESAVESGIVTSGIMYELVRKKIPYVLAASLRDDGPLPGVITDMIEAQDEYSRALQGADMVIMLSTMLHSIAVGNMLPSWVRVICVDINPAVVTKLADRGSSQAVGIVTDVGLFLELLARELKVKVDTK